MLHLSPCLELDSSCLGRFSELLHWSPAHFTMSVLLQNTVSPPLSSACRVWVTRMFNWSCFYLTLTHQAWTGQVCWQACPDLDLSCLDTSLLRFSPKSAVKTPQTTPGNCWRVWCKDTKINLASAVDTKEPMQLSCDIWVKDLGPKDPNQSRGES